MLALPEPSLAPAAVDATAIAARIVDLRRRATRLN
jgi:hypothetical protein